MGELRLDHFWITGMVLMGCSNNMCWRIVGFIIIIMWWLFKLGVLKP